MMSKRRFSNHLSEKRLKSIPYFIQTSSHNLGNIENYSLSQIRTDCSVSANYKIVPAPVSSVLDESPHPCPLKSPSHRRIQLIHGSTAS